MVYVIIFAGFTSKNFYVSWPRNLLSANTLKRSPQVLVFLREKPFYKK